MKMSTKPILLLGLGLLLIPATLLGQSKIYGTITNTKDQPVVGANINIRGSQLGTYSDEKGLFELPKVPAGSYALQVSAIGYQPYSATVAVAQNSNENHHVVLTERTVDINEVIISTNTIIGSKHSVLSKTGSSYYVSKEELQVFNYTDINRVLSTVPGVNLYEEDGYGLRPNISLRGSSPGRSSKITIMEDGVLVAPAPYAAPAAYYFPSTGRMDAIEILKGSSQIQYGPFTTGGAINMVSAQIPESLGGNLEYSYGSYNTTTAKARVGNSFKYGGFVADFLRNAGDGFKKVDSYDNKGFQLNDVVAKLRFNSDLERQNKHILDLKYQYSDELSNETYLGLTDDDFRVSPFRRYAASGADKMVTDHQQLQASYTFKGSNRLLVNITGYYNEFGRNWYKLEGVTLNGKRLSPGDILVSPEQYTNYYYILTGAANNTDNALKMRNNKRRYYSKGIQSKFDYHFYIGEVYNDIEVGFRIHQDKEDRFQWEDSYNMIGKTMVLNAPGTPGSHSNRLTYAKATSAYLLYKLKYGNLYVTPGIRYENIRYSQEDYGKNDPERKGADARNSKNNVGGTFIPGVGVNYKVVDALTVFGGIHKGFAPPGTKEGAKPEESINYELGTRVSAGKLYGEVVGFYNRYSNLLGADLEAVGGSGTLDLFNAGAVDVRGMEVLVNYVAMSSGSQVSFPLSLSYTYTKSEFKSAFKSSVWGEVAVGDEIPYIPRQQIAIGAGLDFRKLHFMSTFRYNNGFRTKVGSGSIPNILKAGESFIVDAILKYKIHPLVGLSASAYNLFNDVYVASRTPHGVRPGLPRTITGGIFLNF